MTPAEREQLRKLLKVSLDPDQFSVEMMDADPQEIDTIVTADIENQIKHNLVRGQLNRSLHDPELLNDVISHTEPGVFRAVLESDPGMVEQLQDAIAEIDEQLLEKLEEEDLTGTSSGNRWRLMEVRTGISDGIIKLHTDSVKSVAEVLDNLIMKLRAPIRKGPAARLWEMNRASIVSIIAAENKAKFEKFMQDVNSGNAAGKPLGQGTFGVFLFPAISKGVRATLESINPLISESTPRGTKIFFQRDKDDPTSAMKERDEEVSRTLRVNDACGVDIYPRIFFTGSTVPLKYDPATNLKGPGRSYYFFDIELVGPSLWVYMGNHSPTSIWKNYIRNWEEHDIYTCLMKVLRALPSLMNDFETLRKYGFQHLDVQMNNVCFDLNNIERLRLIDPGFCISVKEPTMEFLLTFANAFWSWVTRGYYITAPEIALGIYYCAYVDIERRFPTKGQLRNALGTRAPWHPISHRIRGDDRLPVKSFYLTYCEEIYHGEVDEAYFLDAMVDPLNNLREQDPVPLELFVNSYLTIGKMDIFALGASLKGLLTMDVIVKAVEHRAKRPMWAGQNIKELHHDFVLLAEQMMTPSVTMRPRPYMVSAVVKKIYNKNKGGNFMQRV